MPHALPQLTRTYQNHHLDSTRWELYKPRDTDVIITTAYKSGTTWTQQIFYQLIYGGLESPPAMQSVNPWPDAYFMPVSREKLQAWMEGLERTRYIKSHLPLDGLPYFPQVKYVIVCRDPRDVFMSFMNHVLNYTDEFYGTLNDPEKLMGEPMPRCSDDPHELWTDWISRGWFAWESEGYPLWSNLHHTQTYWDYRHLPNFLFMHYNDMLEDLGGAVRKLADFAGIDASEADIARTVEETTFANVKRKATETTRSGDDPMSAVFAGGQSSFFFKGTNGRWRDVLNEEDLVLYEEAKTRVLTPDCAQWLEQGGQLPD